MNKFLIVVFSFMVITVAAQKTKTSKQKKSATSNQVTLSVEDQRRFDYFFYEANREKILGNVERAANYYIECLKIDATSSASLYELAKMYLLENQGEKAAGLLERAVVLNPDNIWYNLLLAEVYQALNKHDKAIVAYKSLVERTNNEEYMYQLAIIYSQSKQYEEALLMLNQIERKIGINESVTLEKQRLYLQLNRGKDAIKEVNKLCAAYPYEYRYKGYLGDLYLYLKDYDSAEAAYSVLLNSNSDYDMVYFSLSNLYYLKGDTAQFKSYFYTGMKSKNIEADYKIQKFTPVLVSFAENKPVLNREEIDSIFKMLLSVNPNSQKAYHLNGQFLKEVKEPLLAYSVMKEGVMIDVKNVEIWQDILFLDLELSNIKQLIIDGEAATANCPEVGLFYMLLSSGYLQDNRANEGLKTLNKGIGYAGDNQALKGQFLSLFGDTHYKLGNSDSAFYFYDEALLVNSKNLSVLNNYAYYLSLENKDLGKAEQMSSRTIELEPSNSTFLDTYAWVLFKRGRFVEAKFIIERAMDNGGASNGVIVEHYGDILYFNNDFEGALLQWQKALILGSEDKELLGRKIEQKTYLSK